jgi:hypothetical protein
LDVSGTREFRFRREPPLRRVLIDCIREFAAEPREQIFSRQTGLFRQGIQHIRAYRLLKLGRRQLFVGTRFDPGLRGFALATLLEAVDDFAEPATKNPAGTGTTETAAQLAEQATDAALSGSSGRALSYSAEHFGDLVPILVARDCEQSQKGHVTPMSASEVKQTSKLTALNVRLWPMLPKQLILQAQGFPVFQCFTILFAGRS